jgi:hypothetical protein
VCLLHVYLYLPWTSSYFHWTSYRRSSCVSSDLAVYFIDLPASLPQISHPRSPCVSMDHPVSLLEFLFSIALDLPSSDLPVSLPHLFVPRPDFPGSSLYLLISSPDPHVFPPCFLISPLDFIIFPLALTSQIFLYLSGSCCIFHQLPCISGLDLLYFPQVSVDLPP